MQDLTRDEIDRFLDEQTVGRIGCHADGLTYVVPVIFARRDQELYVLTTEGQKTRMMRASPMVCFEVDEYDRATGSWRSVIVHGRYEELGEGDRAAAVSILGQRFGGRRPQANPQPGAPPPRPVVAFRIRIESATGRTVQREG